MIVGLLTTDSIFVCLFVVFIVFRIFTCLIPSYQMDMIGYLYWSRYLAQWGTGEFYGIFHVVYPPGYMYLLWISGKLMLWTNAVGSANDFWVKIWSVAFDGLGAYLLFRLARRLGSDSAGRLLALFYLIHPTVIVNSSAWGQFDTIFTTILFASAYALIVGKKELGAVLFVIAVLTKPQSIFGAVPLIAAYFYGFSLKTSAGRRSFVFTLLRTVGLVALAYGVIALPFRQGRGVFWVISHLMNSRDDYPYATANGFNFWTVVGGQGVVDWEPWLGLTYARWGLILLGVLNAYCGWMVIKGKASASAVLQACFLANLGAFVFYTRMHERYMFPAILFGLSTLIVPSPHRALWAIAAIGTSLCSFANHWIIYQMSFRAEYWILGSDPAALRIAWVTLVLTSIGLYASWPRPARG